MTASCNSCLNREDCCDKTGVCRKYKTNVILIWNGAKLRFHCSVNMKFSEWYKRYDLAKTPELYKTIAEQIGVRTKDVWLLTLADDLPKEKLPTPFPTYELTDEQGNPISGAAKRDLRYHLASWLTDNYHFATIEDSDVTYVYENGVYIPKGAKIITEAIRQALAQQCNTYDRNETIAIIRDNTLIDRKIFTQNPDHKICLENGIIDLDTGEFSEHTPKEHFLTKIPVEYNPDAQCPNIDKFHSEIVDKTDVQTLEEIIGYCLYNSYPIHKAFMLVGGGANGKSTWLNMVKAFLGKENVSSLSLQQLGWSRFSTSFLVGKLANIYADLTSEALKHTGTFKMLVGNDLIGAEIKFGKHFTFENPVKFLFSTNQIPQTEDDTDAYFRRWVIIVFPYQFTDEPNAERKADHNILDKITTKEEMSGLLNKSIKALNNLIDKGRFHGDKPTAEWRIDYIRKSDPIEAFYIDCLEEINDLEMFIEKNQLYQAFIQYCKKMKLPPVDNTVFSRKIKAHFEIAHEATRGSRAEPRRKGWVCIKLKDDTGLEQGSNLEDYK